MDGFDHDSQIKKEGEKSDVVKVVLEFYEGIAGIFTVPVFHLRPAVMPGLIKCRIW